jgi:hypothetical protein
MKSTLRACFGSAAIAIAMAALAGAGRLAGSSQDVAVPHLTLRIIVVSSMEAAERVAKRLEAGESFVAVAKAESTDRTAERGGWLGRLALADLRDEVRRALAGAAPGTLSPVVRIPTGFAIFKVEADEAAGRGDRPAAALAASGAVQFVFDVGVSEERVGSSHGLFRSRDLDARVSARPGRTPVRLSTRSRNPGRRPGG